MFTVCPLPGTPAEELEKLYRDHYSHHIVNREGEDPHHLIAPSYRGQDPKHIYIYEVERESRRRKEGDLYGCSLFERSGQTIPLLQGITRELDAINSSLRDSWVYTWWKCMTSVVLADKDRRYPIRCYEPCTEFTWCKECIKNRHLIQRQRDKLMKYVNKYREPRVSLERVASSIGYSTENLQARKHSLASNHRRSGRPLDRFKIYPKIETPSTPPLGQKQSTTDPVTNLNSTLAQTTLE